MHESHHSVQVEQVVFDVDKVDIVITTQNAERSNAPDVCSFGGV
jgi:hypothetical protein